MEQLQTACKTLQIDETDCMVKPTSSDLTFDFSMNQTSICFNCEYRGCCKVADLLNVPVKACTFFVPQAIAAVN